MRRGSAAALAPPVSTLARSPAGAARRAGHLFAGAVAGAVSRTATAPLETLRLAAMAGGLPPGARLEAVAASLVQQHGWRALYKGESWSWSAAAGDWAGACAWIGGCA